MKQTIVEKILSAHAGKIVKSGDIADVKIDVRLARDFGGANVVNNIKLNHLEIDDSTKTFFTFDCNPGGSDPGYAENQQKCRVFAREKGIHVFDINSGIGTHVAIEEGLAVPGSTLISTDSHANILGSIGAFGQGMGDVDTAYAFANGKIWFKVPKSVKIVLNGHPSKYAAAKDVILFILGKLGAAGLLGYAAEFYGDYVDSLGLSGRITMASMTTEMAGIIGIFPPNQEIIDYCSNACGKKVEPVLADVDANYEQTVEIDINNLVPHAARPGHPEDVVTVKSVYGKKIDSAFIGSCTNGRIEDLASVAEILKNRKLAPGVVLKIVPSTDKVWRKALEAGYVDIFKKAGVLFGNAGCAGCAAGQIGQNGTGEVTVSTGNRNFVGKQGKGEVFLVSPAVAAASAVAGMITTPDKMPDQPAVFAIPALSKKKSDKKTNEQAAETTKSKLKQISGRVWVINKDNIDTDMIYHNRYLAITDINKMGQFTFDNLKGWENFSKHAKPGDIVVTGNNFGAGSSRQQAVDCFISLKIGAIVAKSFGAIYERNAINKGFPIICADLLSSKIKNNDIITIDFETGSIKLDDGSIIQSQPFSSVQMNIYQRGGLL